MRFRRLLRISLATAVSLALFPAWARAAHGLVLTDDRGQPITDPLTARLVDAGSTSPSSVVLRSISSLPGEWEGLVEVEGDGHGPVRFRVEDLKAMGGRALVVPRKAVLSCRGAEGSVLSSTYYVISDRKLVPFLKGDGRLPQSFKVPAGSGLLVLEGRDKAQDVRLFDLAPGSAFQVEPRMVTDSLGLVRVARRSDGAPVGNASLQQITTDEKQQRSLRPLCRTDQHGLCLLRSPSTRLPVIFEAKGLVSLETQLALDASIPSRVETVQLDAGSRPTFRVRVDGSAGAGLPVGLRPGGADAGRVPAESSREKTGTTDKDGLWGPGTLPSGPWIARVQAQKGTPSFEKAVELQPDDAATIDLELSRIPLIGEVTRAGKGVPSEPVIIGAHDLGLSYSTTERDGKEQETVTDADGKFGTFVWREGVYHVYVGPRARKVVSIPKIGKYIALKLASQDLVCVVEDPDGHPVPGALVRLAEGESDQSWTGNHRTDANGSTSFPVRVGNELTISARASGFRPSANVTLVVPEDGGPPPVRIRLERDDALHGRFLGNFATPVPGALVAAQTPNGQFVSAPQSTDAEGRFQVSRSVGKSFRLFMVSQNAPLTMHDVYDVGQDEEVVFAPASSGTLEVLFVDKKGAAIAGRQAVLEQAGVLIQPAILTRHLMLRGLSSTSDARGSLIIPDIPTGEYSVILPDVPAPDGRGPLRANVSVAPGRNSLRVTLEEVPSSPGK